MATLSAILSSISSSVAKLLPESSSDANLAIEKDLNKLTKTLERIKATLYDAEEREIRDRSVKLWLKELKEVAYAAEDVLDEYNYEVLRVQVEARSDSAESSHKRKKLQLPDDLAERVKETIGRFDEIANDRIALQLHEGDGPRRFDEEMQISRTSHLVVESNIFGRENEKEKLINLVLADNCNDGVVSVVAIVGVGGLGKTTLARLVYNDLRIERKFHKSGWVFVSDDFNVERLTKEVMESFGCSRDVENLSVMQKNLKENIVDKKIFLVLDDVWNEESSLWESFRIPFLSAESVKILVTTRNEPVARIMQTVPSFYLGYLSEKQCWQLFKKYAFIGENCNEGWMLGIGKLIMKKCGWLPLVVKSIASLLRHEANEDSWREILESELWELESTKKIFPPLQISYARLPSYLKPCLLYCSLFPKDYLINGKELSRLWFAQGYIQLKGKKTIEQIGKEYVKQLSERSFFEYQSTYVHRFGSFRLHDMIHDLALSNSANECYSIEYGKPPIYPKHIYHLYVADSYELRKSLPSSCSRVLRTIIMNNGYQDFSTFPKSSRNKIKGQQRNHTS